MTASLAHLPAGTLVSVSRGFYRHVGLLTEPTFAQERQVISLNPGAPRHQVIEESLSAFARGNPVRVVPMATTLPGWAILARARSGQHPQYAWAAFNCEHFARFALGHKLESPQLALWMCAVFAIGLSTLR
jgi:hypothetical protein